MQSLELIAAGAAVAAAERDQGEDPAEQDHAEAGERQDIEEGAFIPGPEGWIAAVALAPAGAAGAEFSLSWPRSPMVATYTRPPD